MGTSVASLTTVSPFDLAFLDAMIPHHEGAVKLSLQAADHAQRAELKALAADILRDQRAEIAQMRAWRALWYPSAPAGPATTL